MNCRVSQQAAFDSFYVVIFQTAGFWKYLNIIRYANLKSRTINKHVKLKKVCVIIHLRISQQTTILAVFLLVECSFIVGLQGLSVSFKTNGEFRISDNANWASKYASFFG